MAVAVALACAGTAAPALAQDHKASSASRRDEARPLPAREIERRVVPRYRGAQYLGFVYDPETRIYTLKFLRNGSVIWVDVDETSGRILRETGN